MYSPHELRSCRREGMYLIPLYVCVVWYDCVLVWGVVRGVWCMVWGVVVYCVRRGVVWCGVWCGGDVEKGWCCVMCWWWESNSSLDLVDTVATLGFRKDYWSGDARIRHPIAGNKARGGSDGLVVGEDGHHQHRKEYAQLVCEML